MSDSENEKKPDSEEAPSVMTPESLKESLDELAKNVDSLVDRLTMDMTDSPVDENRSKQPAVPPTAPARTPPATPVPDEPAPAPTFAPEAPAETPETTLTAADEDFVAAGSIDEDLEIMGLAGDVIDSVTGTEADQAEADASSVEGDEPEAMAEMPATAPMTIADRIDAELAKTAAPTADSAAEAEDDDFMAMSNPVEPPGFEDVAIGPEELSSPVEPEPRALDVQDAHTAPEPPEPLDLDVQKTIDAIDAGLDSLLVQDAVETGGEKEEPESLKLADGHQAESAAPEIKPAGMPDQAPAAGQTSRLKKPARADVIPWSTTSKPGRSSHGMSRTWRLVAAVLFLGAVCGGAWVMLSTDEPPTIDFQLAASGGANRDSGDATSRTAGSAIPFIPAGSGDGELQADSPWPDETAVAQPETSPASEAPAAAPAAETRAPSSPRAETPKPLVAKNPTPAPSKKPSDKLATKPTPKPRPLKQETKPAEPEPKTAVKTAPSDTPKVADARPAPTPVAAPKPPPPEQPVAAVTSPPGPATPDETSTEARNTAPATAVVSTVDRDLPAPVEQPVPAPPEPAPELVPPQLVTRQEPIYPSRARKRGEGGVVELEVLVNEHGRVVRVVVEQGLPGSELEARAIDAALRSTYRPATEAGQPVRAWVTERFVFEP